LSLDNSNIINGWRLFAHPLFLAQVEALSIQVDRLRTTHPDTYQSKKAFKQLAAIRKLISIDIPEDPTREIYRQGDTLGNSYKHWFRAKFYQQYRLFFRFHKQEKIIVFAWVNDDRTKRAYGSKSDAYTVFRAMLDNGNPPDDWASLCRDMLPLAEPDLPGN
jgi:toxin YhaV